MTNPDRVVIVGAGPVGLVSALRLSTFGIPSVIVEKSPTLPQDLRATTFHPPTLDMLDELGVAEPFIALGIVTPSWQVLHLETGERAEFPLSAISDLTRHPYRLQCEQHKLGRIMLERAMASDLVELHLGTEVTAVAQDGEGVTATAMRDGEAVAFRGAYMIGADGSRSITRQALQLPLEGETYPSETLLITTPFPFENHVPNIIGANYVWGPTDSFSMFQLRQEWRCTFYPRAGEADELGVGDAMMQERLRGIVPDAARFEINEARPYRIHMRIVPDYRRGRIVLAGDAAHLNAPTGGMGMNGGVHDAFNLTDKLRRIMVDGESEDLLDVYTRQRRPVALEEIIGQTHQNRTRMEERSLDKQMESLRGLQAITADPARLRAYVVKASMLEGLRKAAALS
jgi:3-(3-hydroxy-phenyl)propionate hydroxylase